MDKFAQLEKAPLFIVGAARSGTTWVHDIYKAHPLVAAAFETWLFTERGLGIFFTETHFPSPNSGLGRLMSRDDMLEISRKLAREVLSKAIQDEARFLVEKSPNHLFHAALIREIFPNARFLHVLRDGRDVSVSVRAAVNSWQPSWGNSFGRSVASHAASWEISISRARSLKERIGEDFMEIRYEDLRRQPFENYARLFDFLGVPYDDAILQTVHEKTDFEKNYEGGEERFRRGGRIADWRKRFSLLDALHFQRKAGKTLIELGYADSPWWWTELLRFPSS
jgi:hypothetical protein